MESSIYCLKCKQKTGTKDIEQVKTKNNRNMLKGICLVCGSKKSCFARTSSVEFVKNVKGEGVVDTLIDKMPEMHMPGYNFLGPFTKLKDRLDKNNNPLPNSKPINELDEIALKHDICYGEEKSFKDKNKICDTKMLADLKILKPKSISEWVNKQITQGTIGLKHLSRLGVKR